MCPSPRLTVCHVTTVHDRRDSRIFAKECRSLSGAGHRVYLLVGDGQGDALVDGVTIKGLGPKPRSRFRRMWDGRRKAANALREFAPDIIHFHDPELLPLGARLARRGSRVIYDVHEDVPAQILEKFWLPRGLRWAVARGFAAYEQHAAASLAGIVAATPHIASRFLKHAPPVVVVNNYPLADELVAPSTSAHKQRRICYVGAVTAIRGLLNVIRALPLVPAVRLTVCGRIGEPGLESALRSEPGWSQVDFLGPVGRDVVREVMAESSAGVVTFLPAPNHVDSQPTKMFEYMSAALPVIASDFPLWRTFVEGSGAGICVDPQSPAAIARAVSAIVDQPGAVERMGQAGRLAVLTKYQWAPEAERLIEFYERLTCT